VVESTLTSDKSTSPRFASNAQYLWITPDGRRRTFPMDRSIGHRVRPTLPRRSGRHARAYGSHRGRQHAKWQFVVG
jgi:hypothetical protein